MIQNKEVIMNGFRNLNKEISNKQYNQMQNVTKQTLEQLKVLRGVLKGNYQTPQYNPGMEDLISNLSPTQPALEEASSARRL